MCFLEGIVLLEVQKHRPGCRLLLLLVMLIALAGLLL